MDWKREAIDKLKCYEAKKSSIARSTEGLAQIEDDLTRIRSATTDSTPVRGGTSTREDVLINSIAHKGELKRARRVAARWVKLVDGGLAELDEEERHILDRFYINRAKGNVERLCEELNLEKTRVYERKDAALRHFTLALYGVVET